MLEPESTRVKTVVYMSKTSIYKDLRRTDIFRARSTGHSDIWSSLIHYHAPQETTPSQPRSPFPERQHPATMPPKAHRQTDSQVSKQTDPSTLGYQTPSYLLPPSILYISHTYTNPSYQILPPTTTSLPKTSTRPVSAAVRLFSTTHRTPPSPSSFLSLI